MSSKIFVDRKDTHLLLYQALVKKYQAKKAEAEATLSVYFNSSVGIGEHPQIIEEIDKCIHQLSEAEDHLSTMRDFYPDWWQSIDK